MLKVENMKVFNFEGALRGMRNPYDSWDKSDSEFYPWDETSVEIGEKDLDLMKRLYKGGSEHRKYLRQIFVSLDITAPLYWWKEFDTYKVGTVANSCSTMHTIHKKEFILDDFSHEHLDEESIIALEELLVTINIYRDRYVEAKDKQNWWQLIQLLPSSYNQKRTVTMNYENIISIIKQRTGHRLDEWATLIAELKTLPYIEEIMEE